jgi:hypothetical protein
MTKVNPVGKANVLTTIIVQIALWLYRLSKSPMMLNINKYIHGYGLPQKHDYSGLNYSLWL